MTIYLAWSPGLDDPAVPGPWQEVRPVAHDLWLLDSEDTLSRVYHELKWSLADEDAPLLVVPAGATPKLRGLPGGTQTWLRERTRSGAAARGTQDWGQ